MFDAGGVLTRPIGGRWNPRYDFEDIVMSHHPQVPQDLFPRAIEAEWVLMAFGRGGIFRPDQVDAFGPLFLMEQLFK